MAQVRSLRPDRLHRFPPELARVQLCFPFPLLSMGTCWQLYQPEYRLPSPGEAQPHVGDKRHPQHGQHVSEAIGQMILANLSPILEVWDLHATHLGAKSLKLLDEALISAIDVVHIRDGRIPIRDKPRHDERRATAQVG